MTPGIEARLSALGLELPPAPKPGGVYRPVIVVGSMAHGRGTARCGRWLVHHRPGGRESRHRGGREAARYTALAVLSSLKAALGSLDRVVRVVKLLGMVQATRSSAITRL